MLEFLTSLVSLMKSFSDFIKKHVSFYAVLLTCSIVSYVAFAFERTTGFLYFGIGCTLFFSLILLLCIRIFLFPIWFKSGLTKFCLLVKNNGPF